MPGSGGALGIIRGLPSWFGVGDRDWNGAEDLATQTFFSHSSTICIDIYFESRHWDSNCKLAEDISAPRIHLPRLVIHTSRKRILVSPHYSTGGGGGGYKTLSLPPEPTWTTLI